MPFVDSNGARIYWQSDGGSELPALLLLNSLGTDCGMWDGIVPELTPQFHVLRTDARGHGRSQTTEGDYTIGVLAEDALAVLDATGVTRAHVCGLSMGALIAAHIAARDRDRVDALILCNITTEINPADWDQRAKLVRESGMSALTEAVLSRFLSPAFLESGDQRVDKIRTTLASTDAQGYAACCIAIGHAEVLPHAMGAHVPRLLSIGGSQDAAAPVEHARKIAASVPGGRLEVLDTGHLSATEDPNGFAEAVKTFLEA
ncbi:MAG: 3-oxoadipate enol-lactonase [Erythrobacter sp.]|jgi:3-oxoadipate enol-lactonase/4-carboxymuconolactone decarboxylase